MEGEDRWPRGPANEVAAEAAAAAKQERAAVGALTAEMVARRKVDIMQLTRLSQSFLPLLSIYLYRL